MAYGVNGQGEIVGRSMEVTCGASSWGHNDHGFIRSVSAGIPSLIWAQVQVALQFRVFGDSCGSFSAKFEAGPRNDQAMR